MSSSAVRGTHRPLEMMVARSWRSLASCSLLLVLASGCTGSNWFGSDPMAAFSDSPSHKAPSQTTSKEKDELGAQSPDLPPHMRKLADGEKMPVPTFSMELHGKTKVKSKKVPLEGVTFLQDALDQGGFRKAAGRYDIEVMRFSGKSDMPAKLDVKFDPRTREIDPRYNYQLLPGDRVVCKPNDSNSMDDFVDEYMPFVKTFGG